ncbi:hypothetical protein MOB37_18490 [Bacillus spizizenii]|uniref:hypothetical protein n=1 Tax=Bacillus inaquosorum TaxID=483913 RepID=UPI00227E7ED9|nr:hypothetical protein [Bacillus inaquosorum]MCY7829868.1 hypothetical protein [Bacillus spizizenii]MCY7839726.1 hypothetical protein [Bacillus spizizenii]MCY8706776.1 hypothetical protein [Bacillus inaquosorum]
MKLYTNHAGEILNYGKNTFYAWSKPGEGDKEITVIPGVHIIEEGTEGESYGKEYLLRPGSYDFVVKEGAE